MSSGLGFTMPVSGKITSPFGIRRAPRAGATVKHEGIDIAVPVGTPVKSALGGVVKKTGSTSAQGTYIVVDHGGGLESVYKHLSHVTAKVGTAVNEGDMIARSGNTGVSTGPHLEFQLIRNGTPIDPMSFTKESAAAYSLSSGHFLEQVDSSTILQTVKKYWWIIAGGLVVAAIIR